MGSGTVLYHSSSTYCYRQTIFNIKTCPGGHACSARPRGTHHKTKNNNKQLRLLGRRPLPHTPSNLTSYVSSPGRATLCKPHKHDDDFPLRQTKLPSLTFNLVGRRLRSAKRAANTLPPSIRASAYCCLLRRLNCWEPRMPILPGCATVTRRDTPRGRPSPCSLGRDGGGLALLAATSLSAVAGVQQGGTMTTTTLCPASIHGGSLGRRRRRLGWERWRRQRDDCCRR